MVYDELTGCNLLPTAVPFRAHLERCDGELSPADNPSIVTWPFVAIDHYFLRGCIGGCTVEE